MYQVSHDHDVHVDDDIYTNSNRKIRVQDAEQARSDQLYRLRLIYTRDADYNGCAAAGHSSRHGLL